MSSSAKDVPSQLRTPSAIAAAHTHRDRLQPVAGSSSGTSGNFRSAASQPRNEAFNAFLEGKHPESPSSPTPESLDTARIFATSWTAEDLSAHPSDGADILQLLNEENALATVNDPNESPDFSPYAYTSHERHAGVSFDQTTAPFLFEALRQDDGEAIVSYLQSTSYTDDVWGLPASLKSALDTVKSASASQDSRQTAIQRLQQLQSHLRIGRPSSSAAKVGTSTFSEADWETIWRQWSS
ncbi:hypothetical protein EMMF5_002713 [Cystobasidiomycetes sp. EMM_F5]